VKVGIIVAKTDEEQLLVFEVSVTRWSVLSPLSADKPLP
jgi:hypothetical protein